MSGRLKRIGVALFDRAMAHNIETIREPLASLSPGAIVADLGCGDGAATRRTCPPTAQVAGVEVDPREARAARSLGLAVATADLNHTLPFDDGTFDAVVSNQVIEHLHDTDTFIAECYRVVRPGGLTVISTENMSSWHNIFAVTLGWQAFSLTNISSKRGGVGNPLALLRDEAPFRPERQHQRILSYRGLRELLIAHGFTKVVIKGSGYYPLPARFGAGDPRHAAFITAIARRPA